jgi:hypothetical protein
LFGGVAGGVSMSVRAGLSMGRAVVDGQSTVVDGQSTVVDGQSTVVSEQNHEVDA